MKMVELKKLMREHDYSKEVHDKIWIDRNLIMQALRTVPVYQVMKLIKEYVPPTLQVEWFFKIGNPPSTSFIQNAKRLAASFTSTCSRVAKPATLKCRVRTYVLHVHVRRNA